MTHPASSPKRPRTGAAAARRRGLLVNPGVLAAILFGVLFAASVVEVAVRGWREWAHTTGMVTGHPRLSGGRKRATVDFTYAYGAAGARYEEAARVPAAPGESGSALLARFRPGAPVPVYYDPRRPERSRLFGSPRESQVGGLLLGGLGLAMGIAYALLFPRERIELFRPSGARRAA